MTSLVAGDLLAIETGVCSIKFKDVFVGHTLAGVRLQAPPDLRDRLVAAHGTSPVDAIAQGDDVRVTMTLVESGMKTLTMALPFTSEIDANTRGLGIDVGSTLRSVAGALLIHLVAAGEDDSDDLQFWKVAVIQCTEIGYDANNDRVYECELKALFDETRPRGERLGRIGSSRPLYPPVLVVDETELEADENGQAAIGANVTDQDSEIVAATIAVDGGTFDLASTAGLTFSSGANGTAAMVFAGSPADVTAALDLAVFTSDNTEDQGVVTITIEDLDGQSDAATITIQLADVVGLDGGNSLGLDDGSLLELE